MKLSWAIKEDACQLWEGEREGEREGEEREIEWGKEREGEREGEERETEGEGSV